jgi:hypothetical protein
MATVWGFVKNNANTDYWKSESIHRPIIFFFFCNSGIGWLLSLKNYIGGIKTRVSSTSLSAKFCMLNAEYYGNRLTSKLTMTSYFLTRYRKNKGSVVMCGYEISCRSQCPRGLSDEPSSSARTVGSCVRIPLEARMSACVYFVPALFCVWVAALRRADPPSKEFYRLCTGLKTEKASKVQRAVMRARGRVVGWGTIP